ncbi:MAG: T9SS type A sorting domain-containing protein, partial [Flavobacteriales bacterium]
TGSILLNTAKGHKLYKAPYALAQWASVDTAGLAASWPQQHNSETNWSSGAFNQGLTANPFDLGWGIYNFQTHNITGDSCFVLQLAGGAWKKLRIDGFTAATNSFTFTWANLDGSGEQTGSLVRSAFPGKNFGYYSLANNAALDLEPPADSWDLLFTKYMALVSQPFPAHYPVAGVLQNRLVEALEVDGVPTADAQWWGSPFSAEINVIGFDWKSFNQGTFQWEIAQDRAYFVKDRNGSIWKLVFTGYGGSANGNFIFSQQLASAASVAEAGAGIVHIHPNPASDGFTSIVLDAPQGGLVIDLLDGSGRVVRQQRVMGSGLVRVNLDLGGVPAGLYVVRSQGEGTVAAARLIVD